MPITAPSPTTPSGNELDRRTNQVDARPVTGETDVSNGGSRIRLLAIGAGVLVVAVVAALALTGGSDADADATNSVEPIRAVEAQERDLVETSELAGTLEYADVSTIGAGRDGTVTAIAAEGSTLQRGDTVVEINAEPTVVFYGVTPMYRPLSEGAEGDDVELLEANLASLGFHATENDDGDEVDTGFTVDGVFDAATTDAVQRWQADLGVAETGTVEPASVQVLDGPATVSNASVEVGDRVQTGSPVIESTAAGTVDAVYAAHTGELDLEATTGPVSSGSVLYVVDDLPVVAVVTAETFERTLVEGVEDGDDVAVLEALLADLGYDADGDLEVDDQFDEATTEAIEAFESDLQDTWEDLEVDGAFSATEYIVVEPGTSIGAVTDRNSDVTASGSELFTWGSTGSTRIVTTAIDVADQDKLAEGATVDIEFPDGSLVSGTIADVAGSSTIDPTDPSAEPTLAVEIALSAVPDSAADLNEVDVDVIIVDDLAAGATVVPASALVATTDGGFAVEVVEGTGTVFVAVDPGMFADGFVEVSGIAPGTAVVVPS